MSAEDQARLRAVVSAMIWADVLPQDFDIADLIEPVWPVWRRPIPGTALWVIFEVSPDGETLKLWTMRPDSYWSWSP